MFHQACKEQASFIKYMHVGLIKQHQNICIQTWQGLIHVSLTLGQISGSEPYQYHSIVPFLRVSCINVSDRTPSGTPQTLCKRPKVFWMDMTLETDTSGMSQNMNNWTSKSIQSQIVDHPNIPPHFLSSIYQGHQKTLSALKTSL